MEFVILILLALLATWCLYDDIMNLASGAKKVKEAVRQFSVSEYLSRIEKEADDIAKGAWRRDRHNIVLWWGLDGLKLNEDGTAEWIKKYGRDDTAYDCETIDVSTLEDTAYRCIIGGSGGAGHAGCVFYGASTYPYIQYYGHMQQFQPYFQPQSTGVQQSAQSLEFLETQTQNVKIDLMQKQQVMAVENTLRTLRGM